MACLRSTLGGRSGRPLTHSCYTTRWDTAVSDEGAADFVQRFYRHWLAQAESDPPAAFRAAQLEAMAAPPDSPARRDQTWAHFVLVGR